MLSNYQQLATSLQDSLLFTDANSAITVQNLVNTFLRSVSSANYLPMVTQLNASIVASGVASFRLLVTTSDGTVAYDISKGAANTYDNFLDKTINENHNTRPEILLAVLNSTGTGLSERYSSSSGSKLIHNALRLGSSVNANLGTYRASLTA